VLHPYLPGRLWFVRYWRDDPMRRNRFGIPEPARRGRQLCPARTLNLVLLPLVGFDAGCNRIGMGKGYYDRSFAFLRARQHWQRPLLIGLAHECQRIETIAPRPWDVPLDAVVTERRIYWRARSRQRAQLASGLRHRSTSASVQMCRDSFRSLSLSLS
jgi:5-formyltetrahydrofolate cyclo-ligase